MNNNIQITAIISIVISVCTLLVTIVTKTSDSYRTKTQKYNGTIEIIYLKLLDIYTSKNKDEKIKKFLDNIYEDGMNTTLILEEHFPFLLLKESYLDDVDFEEIKIEFDQFARNIEDLYWKRYEIVHYRAVQSDNWMQEMKKILLLKLVNIIPVLSKMISYLIYSFIGIIGSLVIRIIGDFFCLNPQIANTVLNLSLTIFIIYVILAFSLLFIEKFLDKKIQKNYLSINGNTFIKDRTKSYMQVYSEKKQLNNNHSSIKTLH